MVKYKIIILTLAFLAALFASLSIPNWGGQRKAAAELCSREWD